MKNAPLTFKALLDEEAFCNACSDNGYEAEWDASARAVVLTDTTGRHYFKAGLKARDVLYVLQQDKSAATLQSMLFDAVVADEAEYF